MATPPDFVSGAVLEAAQLNKIANWQVITTTTFSAVSTLNIDNIFSADFRNYWLTFDYTTTGANNVNLQMRVSGSNAATNYNVQSLDASSSTVTGARNTSLTSLPVLYSTNGNFQSHAQLFIFRPFLAEPTTMTLIGGENYAAYTSPLIRYNMMNHSTATSYTGLGLSVSGGQTTTGRYTVYGLRI